MMSLYFRRLHNKMAYKAQKSHLFLRIITFLMLIAVILIMLMYDGNFKPVLAQLSIARASAIGQTVINEAVSEVMKRDEIVQNKLVILEKDDSGQVCAVTPDLAVINKLKSELAIIIQENLHNVNNSKIYIPVGNLTGFEILSNKGPKIPINLIPLGKAAVNFNSTFSKAGINQTRLQISVDVALDISLLLPSNSSAGARVETTIPMSETIIVGNVPESYTNIESTPEELRGDIFDLLG